MFNCRSFIIMLTLVMASLLLVSAAWARPSARFVSLSEENCQITAVVTVGDAGQYFFEVFDDGMRLITLPFVAQANETLTLGVMLERAPMEGAPGVAVGITNGEPAATIRYYALVDPFLISTDCLSLFDCQQITIPESAVVGALPELTQAYYEPGNISPNVFLNPGTYWVFDTDTDAEGRSYYRILLACNYLYVPLEAMEPNFDAVWQGRALPTLGSNVPAGDQ